MNYISKIQHRFQHVFNGHNNKNKLNDNSKKKWSSQVSQQSDVILCPYYVLQLPVMCFM